MDNASIITGFTLSGFDEIMDHRILIFSLALLCYCLIVLVNGALIITILMDQTLHEPMYILVCNLCVSALLSTTGFYPRILLDLLSYSHVISYAGCMLQSLVIYSSVGCEFIILAVMAFDRYVAICRPLHYHSTMTKLRVTLLVSYPWVSSYSIFIVIVILTNRLELCGSHIQKLYCAFFYIVKLSCIGASHMPNRIMRYIGIPFFMGHALLILCSYVQLIRSCFKSIECRGKFMQTCTPHLLALLNCTVSILFDAMYAEYSKMDLPQNLQNFLTIEFLLVPPILNPIIYGLKLVKIRQRILLLLFKKSEGKKKAILSKT